MLSDKLAGMASYFSGTIQEKPLEWNCKAGIVVVDQDDVKAIETAAQVMLIIQNDEKLKKTITKRLQAEV